MIPILLATMFLRMAEPQALPPGHPPVASAYVPQRVFDTRQKTFSDFETMLADLARADAVFVGEQHDDPNTHRLELAIVEGLTRRGVPVVVAMEMFERDVQGNVDQYAAGTMTEEQFLKDSRPWPRYATDYRPIIEFAKANHLPIIARRTSASTRRVWRSGKTGLSAVDGLGADRRLAARDLQCPTSGNYYDRFVEAMGGHAGATPNFYFAQCVKDETMGESVAEAFQKSARPRRHRPCRRRVPQRLRRRHGRQRAAPDAGPPHRRRLDPAGERYRRRDAVGLRSQAGRFHPENYTAPFGNVETLEYGNSEISHIPHLHRLTASSPAFPRSRRS